MFCTKQGAWSVCISIKNHDTHAETSNLYTRLWHYMAKNSFSKVIDRKATKVPYTFKTTASYIIFVFINNNYTVFVSLTFVDIYLCGLINIQLYI